MATKRLGWGSKGLLVLCAAGILFVGCAETSRINTEPEGARVYVNGMHVGPSPTVYKYRAGLPDTYILEIKKEGYKTLSNVTIDRSLRADISLLLLIAAIVPYFFSARLEDQYLFTLEPEKGTVVPAAVAPAPAPAPAVVPPAPAPVPDAVPPTVTPAPVPAPEPAPVPAPQPNPLDQEPR